MIKVVDDFGVKKIKSSDDAIEVVLKLIEREISIQNNIRLMKSAGIISEEECEKIVSANSYAINRLNEIYLLLPSKQENE